MPFMVLFSGVGQEPRCRRVAGFSMSLEGNSAAEWGPREPFSKNNTENPISANWRPSVPPPIPVPMTITSHSLLVTSSSKANTLTRPRCPVLRYGFRENIRDPRSCTAAFGLAVHQKLKSLERLPQSNRAELLLNLPENTEGGIKRAECASPAHHFQVDRFG